MNQHQLRQYIEHNFFYGEQHRLVPPEYKAVSESLIIPDPASGWGMDISVWDGLVDLSVSKAKGCKFVYVKLLDGTLTSKYGPENFKTAIDVALPRSSYGWLYRDANVPCKAQAQAYTDLLQKYAPSTDLPPAIDFETTYYSGAVASPDYSDLRKWATEFLRLGNPKPYLYTGKWFTDPLGPMPSDLVAMFAGIWIANYSTTTNPPVTTGFSTWKIHQYASIGDAQALAPGTTNKQELDLNRSAVVITQPPDTNGGQMRYGTINYEWTNMRAGAGATYADIGDLHLGTEIEFDTVSNNYCHLVSAKFNGNNVLTTDGKTVDQVNAWAYFTNVTEHAAPIPPTSPAHTVDVLIDGVNVFHQDLN